MASGSRVRGHGSAVAGADALDTLINSNLAHLPAVDVALVVAVLERKLAEAEARIRAAEAEARTYADSIRALKLRIANAEALARDGTVAGEDESQAGDHLLTVSDVGAAELTGDEIRARDLQIVVFDELRATGEITPGVGFEAGAEVGDDDDIPSPIPLMRIDASPIQVTAADPALPEDEVIEERAVEEVVVNVAVPRSHDEVAEAGVVDCRREKAKAIARKRKKPASSLELDDLRATSHEVSDEEAHGEDVTASPHNRSQGKLPAKAKKARRPKGPSFYIMVLKALKEKENLLKKKEQEALAKRAAAAASKQPHCKCYCA